MRRIIYKSGLMIFVYMISTVFIILIQNMQSKSHKDFYKASTFLSDNYIKIEGTNKSGIREFLKEADKMTAENLILLDMGEGRMAVKYKDDSKFKLELRAGRNFCEDDFIGDSKTIIISEDLLDQCNIKDGKRYYFIYNTYYEVIGVMDSKNYDYVNNNIMVYINANSIENMRDVKCIYCDGNSKSLLCMKEISKSLKRYDYGTREYIESTDKLGPTNLLIKVFFVVGVLGFFNVVQATYIWFEGRRNECGIRLILGQTSKQISVWIQFQYMIRVLVSVLLGNVLAIIINYLFIQVITWKTPKILLSANLTLSEPVKYEIMLLIVGYLVCRVLLANKIKEGVGLIGYDT